VIESGKVRLAPGLRKKAVGRLGVHHSYCLEA